MADFEEPEGPPDLSNLRKPLREDKRPPGERGSHGEDDLPGERGRYLLWLSPPTVEGEPHWAHFSWKGQISFCLRDYIENNEVRVEEKNWKKVQPTALQIWRATPHRIKCTKERGLFVAADDEHADFWRNKLRQIPPPDES